MNSFWNFSLHDGLKKRVCRYLLQHYLGTFLAKKISLDQLTVDITKGRGIVNNIELDVQSLNEVFRNQNIPLEMAEGIVEEISVSIPWSALVSEPSVVEVRGLRVTLSPSNRVDAMVSSQLLDSMLGSMVTSMQVAETCVRETPEEKQSGTEGVQRIANTIDTVLSKIRVTLIDSRITLVCRRLNKSVSLQVRIGQAEYFDTAEAPSNVPTPSDQPSSFSNLLLYKSLRLSGLALYLDDAPVGDFNVSGPPTPKKFSTSPAGMPSLPSSTPPLSPPAGLQRPHQQPIKIAEVMGQSEIQLVLKQEDHLPGSKFDCSVEAGRAIHVLLSPTQLHWLLQIVEAFAGRTRGTGQLQRRRRHIGDVAGGPSSRPMSLDDRQRIEEQLLSTSLGQPGELDEDDVGGFRSDSETDEDEQFYSMGPMEDAAGQPDMAESCHSDSTWQPGKNWATAASGTGARLGLPKQCKRPFAFDGSADITPSRVMGLTGELALLTFTVLHSDPETTHDGIDQPVSGRDKLAALSESFFSLIRGLDVNEQPQNLRALRLAMVDLCPHDHLGFLARPLKLTYTLEESRQLGKSSLSVSMGLADFTETLFERKAEPTLALPKPSDLVPRVCDVVAFPEQSLHSSQPSIRIDFVQTERHRGRELDRLSSVKLSLASCLIDVDLTLIDRLAALKEAFDFSQPARYDSQDMHQNQMFDQQPFSSVASEISLKGGDCAGGNFSDTERSEIRVESPQALLRLYFPVPDLRPSGQRQTRWYKKVVRSEWLELRLRQLTLLASLQTDADFALEATCADGLIATLCSETEQIRFAEAWRCSPEAAQAVDGISEAARLHIRMRPARNLRLLPDSIGFDSNAASAPPSGLGTLGTPPMDSILLNPAWGATPFSSKRDLIGKGGGNGQSSFVWESRVLPADPAEMSEFRTNSAANSRLVFELTLARCLINLDCQSNLEMLYNRLLNDLTLWQPAAPAQCDQRTFLPAHINFAEMLGSSGASFSQQFTSFRFSLSAGGSEDEDESRKSSNKLGFRGSPQQQSDLCLSISIQSGRLVGNLPLCPRDLENPQPQAQQAGAVLLDFTDAEVFTVSGHGGNPNKVYTTVALGDFSLYHAGLVPLSFFSEPCFHQLTAPLPEQLQLVLSPNSHMAGSATEKMQFSSRRRQPMLSLAVDAELKSRLKECSIALLVSRAALHYRMQPRQQFWLSQLMNMFELLDYPIEGYSAPLVRTTLHVSFSDIALNYRPTKLQIGSILTVRNAYISSTVQLEANSSACDCLFENADLYLTDRAGSAKWKRDYAHVAGFEVLELHVGMNDSTGVLRKPKFILNCSSRGLQFHLCSDSLQALLSLMSHLANEGDLTTSSGEPGDSADESSCSSSSLLQKRQQPECNNSALSSSVMSSIPMQLQEALSDAGSRAGEADEHVVESQDDLGFTIVDEPGLGLSVRNGDFEVKKICRQPIRIDDHFYPVPAGRADKLKEPKQLGIPLDQVTLRDISFSVSLYGGLDFRATTSNSVTLALSSASYSARQLPTSSKQQSACGRRSDQCMQLQVKKLSVRHSRFPDDSQTLQRQVVIIEDLEILDKVATSPINSFLYRHTSELMPRQTYTPMLSLKLSHQKSESAAHKAECLLMVSLQPVRLIVDQDAFYFLKAFFAEVSQRLSPAQPAQTEPNDACSISAGAVGDAKSEDSFESTGEAADAADSEAAVMETSRQINLLFDELAEGSIVAQRESEQQHQQPLSLQSQQNQQQQLYFRCFVFSPEVFIRLDFNGGRFKPSEGTLGGIALGLLHLNDVELRLKRLEHRGGLLGIDRLCTYALGEWVLDLRDKQKGQVVRGLGPARVFLQLLAGLRDLVWLPVDSWMRHGLLLRGLQRGANSFASSSGAALLDLTGRILGGLQAAAALSQDVLSPLPLTERRRQRRIRAVSRGASARGDFRDACAGAVRVIRETASDTADEMRAAATEGGVVGMIRQLPGAAIGPVVALTGAGHCLTTGAFNHLQPSALADERHKWKGGSV